MGLMPLHSTWTFKETEEQRHKKGRKALFCLLNSVLLLFWTVSMEIRSITAIFIHYPYRDKNKLWGQSIGVLKPTTQFAWWKKIQLLSFCFSGGGGIKSIVGAKRIHKVPLQKQNWVDCTKWDTGLCTTNYHYPRIEKLAGQWRKEMQSNCPTLIEISSASENKSTITQNEIRNKKEKNK